MEADRGGCRVLGHTRVIPANLALGAPELDVTSKRPRLRLRTNFRPHSPQKRRLVIAQSERRLPPFILSPRNAYSHCPPKW